MKEKDKFDPEDYIIAKVDGLYAHVLRSRHKTFYTNYKGMRVRPMTPLFSEEYIDNVFKKGWRRHMVEEAI